MFPSLTDIEKQCQKVGNELVDIIFEKAQREGIYGYVMVLAMTCALTSVFKGVAKTPEAYREALLQARQWIDRQLAESMQ